MGYVLAFCGGGLATVIIGYIIFHLILLSVVFNTSIVGVIKEIFFDHRN